MKFHVIIAFLIALDLNPHSDAAEPWETEPSKAEVAELHRLVKELGGRSVHWTGVELIYINPADLDELPPLRFRCGVHFNNPATDADLKRLARHSGVTTLNVPGSLITEAGIKELAVLKGLQRLDASHTGIGDTGLAEIARLTSLKQINLVGSQVTDGGLRHLAGMKLEKLEVPVKARTNLGLKNYLDAVGRFERLESHYDWPGVTDEGLAALEGRESLRALTWWGDKKMGLTMRRVLPSLKGLYDIHLEGAGVGDDDLRLVAALPNLKKLNVSSNSITDAGLQHLAAMKSLSELYVSQTAITDAGLKTIAKISSLRTLNLIGCNITDDGLKHLADLPELQSLDLRDTPITEAGLQPFVGKKLQSVYTMSPALQTETVFLILFPNERPSTNEFSLAHWRLTDRGLTEIVKRKQAVKLSLRGEFSDEQLEKIADLKELVALNLILETPPSAAVFKKLAKLPRLTDLGIGGPVGDDALKAICEFKGLTGLSLNSDKLTADGQQPLAQLKNLVSLSVVGKLSSDGGKAIGSLPHLERLRLSELSESAAKAMASAPRLSILDLRHASCDDKALLPLSAIKTLKWIDVTFTEVTPEGKTAFYRRLPSCELYEGE